jgi:hypothetical protein
MHWPQYSATSPGHIGPRLRTNVYSLSDPRRCVVSNSIRIALLNLFFLSLVSMSADAQTGVTNSDKNAGQIAVLHWYQANLTTTIPIFNASNPTFDGANIWVLSSDHGFVTKVRASDVTVLGTFSTGGAFPAGLAFDGANIWAPNSQSSNVTKLRASDGTNLGIFNVGTNPVGAAFDGANIWVTNRLDNTVTELRASDGALLGTFSVGTNPYKIVFDGANIWVANSGSNNVTKLRASDGVVVGTFAVQMGGSASGIGFDGTHIWVANTGSQTLSKL